MSMRKPRIVIIDDDFSYIIPLQAKFIYEFLDDVDLEIITDSQYYNEMFCSLQTIDVLIVGEKFFSVDLEKHEIENIFVLTEAENEEKKNVRNIHILYKYTNVKGIFLEIVGQSGLKIPIKNTQKKPEIIMITSACGGVGKTTIGLGIARALSDMYKRVLYIEASRMQSFQYYLKQREPIVNQNVYSMLTNPTIEVYQNIKSELRNETFTYLPPFKAPLMAYGIDYDVYGMIAKAARMSGDFDYIILDTDSTFDKAKAKMMSVVDRVLIVTAMKPSVVYATELLVANINGIASDKYLFICNQYKKQDGREFLTKENINFKMDEYVDDFVDYEKMSIKDFAMENSIRKIAFLII